MVDVGMAVYDLQLWAKEVVDIQVRLVTRRQSDSSPPLPFHAHGLAMLPVTASPAV
jgi:hypothetical protein